MNASRPVSVAPDNNPATPEDTVVTARFNRKKVVKTAGAVLGVLGVLATTFAAGKRRGKDEFIEDVRTATGTDDTDETPAS